MVIEQIPLTAELDKWQTLPGTAGILRFHNMRNKNNHTSYIHSGGLLRLIHNSYVEIFAVSLMQSSLTACPASYAHMTFLSPKSCIHLRVIFVSNASWDWEVGWEVWKMTSGPGHCYFWYLHMVSLLSTGLLQPMWFCPSLKEVFLLLKILASTRVIS